MLLLYILIYTFIYQSTTQHTLCFQPERLSEFLVRAAVSTPLSLDVRSASNPLYLHYRFAFAPKQLLLPRCFHSVSTSPRFHITPSPHHPGSTSPCFQFDSLARRFRSDTTPLHFTSTQLHFHPASTSLSLKQAVCLLPMRL
jgi:hypothetical protein